MELNLKSLKTAPSLDRFIRSESRGLFDLNSKRRRILYILGRDGPSSEYDLMKKCKIDKDSFRRMIRGRESLSKSLTRQGYVIESLDAMFAHVIKKKKEYGHMLTVKGLLASFHGPDTWPELKFEDHYTIRKIHDIILKLSDDNNTLADLSILFIKYNVVLFMAWHKASNTSLSTIGNYTYFENWNSTNSILNPDQFYFISNISKQHNKSLVMLRDDFFVVSCILDVLLSKEKTSKIISQYVRKWPRLAEALRNESDNSSLPSILRHPGPIEGEFVRPEKVIGIAKKLFKDNDINSSKIPKRIPNLMQK